MLLQLNARSSCCPAARLSGCAARARVAPLAAARPPTRVLAGRHSAGIVCVLDLNQDNFDQEVLKSELPVLVDFWATWCGPCKLVAPSMVWAEKEYAGKLKVVKVEVDANPDIVEKYKVYGLPTFIVFKDGAEVEDSKHEGAMTKKALVTYLEKHGIKVTAAA